MSFVVNPVDSIKSNMSIEVPTGVDEFLKQDVTIEFKYLTVTQQKNYQDKLNIAGKAYYVEVEKFKNGEIDEMPSIKFSNEVLGKDLVINIEGLIDSEGGEVKYTKKLMKALLDMDYFATPFDKELRILLWGEAHVKALEKN